LKPPDTWLENEHFRKAVVAAINDIGASNIKDWSTFINPLLQQFRIDKNDGTFTLVSIYHSFFKKTPNFAPSTFI
jgi:hypothetical protein